MSSRDRPPMPSRVSPFAWWSVGLGALSILPCMFIYFVPAISGLVVGVLTVRQVRDWPAAFHGARLGWTGIVLSGLSIALGATAWLLRAYA